MLLDRHRVARLIELSALERTVTGPERLLREEDVSVLVKAAYDDATDAARAEFMARVKPLPTSSWPWSAVQSMAPRGGGGGGAKAILVPAPGPMPPAALVLIRGQMDAPDADSGNRLPERDGSAEAATWEPLHKALDAWNTQTLMKWVGPQGWTSPTGTMPGQVPKDTGNGGSSGGTGMPSGNGGQLPAPAPAPTPADSAITWKHPAVLAAGAAVVVAVGAAIYSTNQSHSRRRLEDALSQQEEQP